MMTWNKIRTVAIASLTLTGMSFGAVQLASAEDGRNAALFGGLAAGALLGGAFVASQHHARSYYDDGDYEGPVVVRHCYRERQAVYDEWGDFAGYRRVRVCN